MHIPVSKYTYFADILVVGGGGGTGFANCGGGGGGGVVYQRNIRLDSGITYNIYVGDGGNGENSSSSTTIYSASTGNDSYIQIGTTDLLINGITYRGYGGGIGGNGRNNGGNGGSGGGSTYGYNSGTSIQGNTYWNGTANIPGGKNGESGYYSSINGWSGGKGGGGFPCNITGINITYAMGGQGIYPSTTTSGTTPDIFGGGAGGGGSTQTGGQKGKSGVVIFKF